MTTFASDGSSGAKYGWNSLLIKYPVVTRKHKDFLLRQRLYLCEEIRWPAERNHDYELVKTTAHFGRPEKPLCGGSLRIAYTFERRRRHASRPTPSRLLRSHRNRPRLLHLQISQWQQDFAVGRVGPRSGRGDGRYVMYYRGLTRSQPIRHQPFNLCPDLTPRN